MNLGPAGRWNEAIAYYDAALRLKPEFPEVHRNLAYSLLCCGDYERGWPEHEWRLKCKPSEGHRINRTFWNGDDFRAGRFCCTQNKALAIFCNSSALHRMVKRRGGQVMLLCPGRLLRLLARCEGVDLAFDAYFVRSGLPYSRPHAEPSGHLRYHDRDRPCLRSLSQDRRRARRALAVPSWPGRSEPTVARHAAGSTAAARETFPDRNRLAGKPLAERWTTGGRSRW